VAELHHAFNSAVREAAQGKADRKGALGRPPRIPTRWAWRGITLVCIEMTIFWKPATLAEAYGVEATFGANSIRESTGLLMCCANICSAFFVKSTAVLFGAGCLSKSACYHDARPSPSDNAGAYASRRGRFKIIEGIFGLIHNVVGLPLEALSVELHLLGRGMRSFLIRA